jgi:amino acid adenylation domain-containing protein
MRPDPLKRILALGQQSPNRPAVTHGGQTLTYGQLGELIPGLSAGIRSRGIETGAVAGDQPVGVAMAPSTDLVAAVLAIQLAGYPCLPLPLDEVPARRREAIVGDGEPWLVIADESGGQALYGGISNVVGLNELRHASGFGIPGEFPGTDDDLAYLIYTSGSTGTPKGVEMRWGALANLLHWQAGDDRLGKPARTALLTPLTFDVAFQEIHGTLLTGGTLVILDPALRRDPVSLARGIREQHIERLFLPFVGLQALAEAATAFSAVPASLNDVVTAGEQLKVTPEIRRFFASLDGAALHNHYGPAETHVVTAQVLTGEPGQWPNLPPIGTPIEGVEVLVLDSRSHEAAPGVEGELYLGGACLARGYRNRPEETDARFVPDPRPGGEGRFYRTGDIGRRSVEGPIEWIGRCDDQVKVRGHRVELGEVESVLSRHEGVRQIVVAARRRGASQELVAYVQGIPGADNTRAAESETLETWRGVWEQTYSNVVGDEDPDFDTSGWISSQTGARIPDQHMREWVDGTVKRILDLDPARVLEVGCGTGLLLRRIAPRCVHYIGLDYSRRVIDRLSETLARETGSSPAVSLACAAAHELDAQVDEPVDLVVMNSVLQHFPSSAYLLDVLGRAMSVTAPGGRIFIGDVTPHAFREAFFAWLELPEGGLDEEGRSAARERVQHRMALDRELTLDPLVFDLLGVHLPRVARVEIQAKKGAERNELTDFRYDVILHLDEVGELAGGRATSWSALGAKDRSVDGVLELVGAGVCVHGVPNARTQVAWQRADELSDAVPVNEQALLDPNDLYVAAEQRGMTLELRPETGCRSFSVGPIGSCAPTLSDVGSLADRQALLRRLADLASNPLRDRASRDLFPRLREFAARELPDYLRPAAYVLLETFPRTSSGKVDRRRLPPPGHQRPDLSTSYAAPRTGLEKATERIWRDVLGLDRIGIDDSFFDLGGNSLGVVTLAAKLGGELGREVPIVTIFEHPTVRSFAAQLAAPSAPSAVVGQGARGALTRDAYRHRRNRRVSRGQR